MFCDYNRCWIQDTGKGKHVPCRPLIRCGILIIRPSLSIGSRDCWSGRIPYDWLWEHNAVPVPCTSWKRASWQTSLLAVMPFGQLRYEEMGRKVGWKRSCLFVNHASNVTGPTSWTSSCSVVLLQNHACFYSLRRHSQIKPQFVPIDILSDGTVTYVCILPGTSRSAAPYLGGLRRLHPLGCPGP